METSVQSPKAAPALTGLKVADFSWLGVGPLSSKYLADNGAMVIRIESHTRLDLHRMVRPYKDGVPGINRSGAFADFNSSKYSITINLNNPGGREIAWKLIRWADVLVENYGTGQMEKWGFDYQSVARVNPSIIYFSTSQLGRTGPYANFRGFGQHAMSISGMGSLGGWPDRGPAASYGAYTDQVAPRFGAFSIMAALVHRQKTGIGQYIEQAQLESLMQMVSPLIADYSVSGRVATRQGNRLSSACPHSVFPCKGVERWIAIAVSSDDEWAGLSRVVGEDWIEADKWQTFLGRKQNEDELEELISGWTARRDRDELMEDLQKAGVPAGAVKDTKDLFEDPQLAHRGFLPRFKHAEMGEPAYSGVCFELSKTPARQRGAPLLGEHNEFVFKEILGMSDDAIADGIVSGAITTEADLPEIVTGA